MIQAFKQSKVYYFFILMENNKKYPFVSICTPTYNRRPFIPILLQCFQHQTYPKDRMEWIIVDDGTDSIAELIKQADIEQIKYYRVEEKMTLGEKRNFMHKKTKGSYIVYMDDDDYYPPQRVMHAVSRLQKNPEYDIAGSSTLYIYYNKIKKMMQFGPYGKNHATAATFAFRKSLLKQTHYDNYACLAEEKNFLKNYSIPLLQLNPLKTILVFAHDHNSVNKYDLLEKGTTRCLESDLQVNHFIRMENERMIYDFFTNYMEELLPLYSQGKPDLKKDVCQSLHVMNEERRQFNNIMKKNAPKIIQHGPNGPIEMSLEETVETLQRQTNLIEYMKQRIMDLEKR